MGVTYKISNEQVDECRKQWPDGEQKVGAIRMVREFTGAGLKEAKDFVESDYRMGRGSDGNIWKVDKPTVQQLISRLFDLSAEIADIHNQLAKMEDGMGDGDDS